MLVDIHPLHDGRPLISHACTEAAISELVIIQHEVQNEMHTLVAPGIIAVVMPLAQACERLSHLGVSEQALS